MSLCEAYSLYQPLYVWTQASFPDQQSDPESEAEMPAKVVAATAKFQREQWRGPRARPLGELMFTVHFLATQKHFPRNFRANS